MKSNHAGQIFVLILGVAVMGIYHLPIYIWGVNAGTIAVSILLSSLGIFAMNMATISITADDVEKLENRVKELEKMNKM